jgi:hypothetical protein
VEGQENNRVYIAVPTDADDDNEVVWIYDRASDRVWLDTYPVVCWGLIDRDLEATGATYATTAETYSSIAPATYASLGVSVGFKTLAHGTLNGYVFQHASDLVIRELEQSTGSTTPAYLYQTPFIAGSSPRFLLSADRGIVEYINLDSPDMSIQFSSKDDSETATVPIDTGNAGEIHTGQSFYRFTGQQLSMRLSGTGPVMIKSFEADVYEEQVEPR